MASQIFQVLKLKDLLRFRKEHNEKCLLAKYQQQYQQSGSEILGLLCSNDPIQILLILQRQNYKDLYGFLGA